MLDTLLATPVATAAGLAAAGLLIAFPLLPSRRAILVAQLGIGLSFTLHFAALGVAAAAALNLLGTVQAAAALGAGRWPALNRVGLALIPLMVAAGLWFWAGPLSAVATLAIVVIALARMQADTLRLRLMLLAGSVLWLLHDALSGLWIALAADVASGLLGLVALLPLLRRRFGAPHLPARAMQPA